MFTFVVSMLIIIIDNHGFYYEKLCNKVCGLFGKNLGFTCHKITLFLYNVFLWYMSKMSRHFILYFCWFDIVALWKFRCTHAYRKGHHLWSLWRLNLFWLSLLIKLNIHLISSTQLSYVSSDKTGDCLQPFFNTTSEKVGLGFF